MEIGRLINQSPPPAKLIKHLHDEYPGKIIPKILESTEYMCSTYIFCIKSTQRAILNINVHRCSRNIRKIMNHKQILIIRQISTIVEINWSRYSCS